MENKKTKGVVVVKGGGSGGKCGGVCPGGGISGGGLFGRVTCVDESGSVVFVFGGIARLSSVVASSKKRLLSSLSLLTGQ